ncbi:MAG: hypothetical protein JO350_06770 [Candidatus Eremiobacteraeota bacterium]|nr:hypothetical protein [Candidatus Eremiobacteraeota bacterium]
MSLVSRLAFGGIVAMTLAIFQKPAADAATTAQDACRFFNAASGSHITRRSRVINQIGIGRGAVGNYCARTPAAIDPHLSAIGSDGKLYNLRDAFQAAGYLSTLSEASAPSRVLVARPRYLAAPPPPDPWTSTLLPQFDLLRQLVGGNSNPCGDRTNQCLADLGTAITGAETTPAAVQLAVPDFVVGSKAIGKDGKHPLFGATVSTAIATPAPSASPSYTTVTTLTLSAENQLYNAFTITQTFGVGTPVTYQLKTDMGTPVGNHASYSLGPVSGASLALQQSQTLGGTFQFCPQISIPLVRGVAFSVDASAACDGTATLQYDTNLAPNLGYVRIAPSIDLKLRGTVTASAILIVGTAQADINIASFDGGTGVIYATFNEPGYGQMFALRPFAYYSGQALSVDVTVAVKTFFGARLANRTFHVYDGVVVQPLSLDKTSWSVVRLAATGH